MSGCPPSTGAFFCDPVASSGVCARVLYSPTPCAAKMATTAVDSGVRHHVPPLPPPPPPPPTTTTPTVVATVRVVSAATRRFQKRDRQITYALMWLGVGLAWFGGGPLCGSPAAIGVLASVVAASQWLLSTSLPVLPFTATLRRAQILWRLFGTAYTLSKVPQLFWDIGDPPMSLAAAAGANSAATPNRTLDADAEHRALHPRRLRCGEVGLEHPVLGRLGTLDPALVSAIEDLYEEFPAAELTDTATSTSSTSSSDPGFITAVRSALRDALLVWEDVAGTEHVVHVSTTKAVEA